MNRRDKDILLALCRQSWSGQRELAQGYGCSLGAVNASVKQLLQEDMIDKNLKATEKALRLLSSHAPKQAVLLAAGPGIHQPMRNTQLPHAMLEVQGQRLIERLICQLQEVGIRRIFVVVGFAKEQFEYLIDRYGVELIINPTYYEKRNLHSLALAADHLENSYIVPCDLWCKENPFRRQELYSWYMVGTEQTTDSSIRVNRMQELVSIPAEAAGNRQLGISYLLASDAADIRSRLLAMKSDRRYKGAFWEEILYQGDRFCIPARLVSSEDVVEVHTVFQLEELNHHFTESAKAHILRLTELTAGDIGTLDPVKRGMTNITFRFAFENKIYGIRIPTGKHHNLVDHQTEAEVYRLLASHEIADKTLMSDTGSGVRIFRWLEDYRACDPKSSKDAALCMAHLRRFHSLKLQIKHSFDLFEAISFYEAGWHGAESLYGDYAATKKQVFSLKRYIDQQEKQHCLIHIDPVPENFLIHDEKNRVRLIDWEYAAMGDPHLDIAMFCLQALYDRRQIDETIDAYFPEGCSREVRLKIYCYIAAGGLLWSNWCEYEMRRGTEFGAYSLRQYRYAKEFYRIIEEELKS